MNSSFDMSFYGEKPIYLAEGQNVIKACLCNLIVLTQDPERAMRYQELMRVIIERFPSRIIFMRGDKSAQNDYLHVQNIQESAGMGPCRVLCDEMIIDVSANQFHVVPYLILPNLMPDLPIYVLLGYDPSQDSIVLPQIEKYATRIIYDPDSIDDIMKFSQKMIPITNGYSYDFVDVNWAKTKAWREVIARVFGSDQNAELLSHAQSVQISYVATPHQIGWKYELQAIYLQAWLASLFRWHLKEISSEGCDHLKSGAGCIKALYDTEAGNCQVTLVARDDAIVDPGSIYSVEVTSESESHFLIAHEGSSRQVKVHSSNNVRCEMPYTLFLGNVYRGGGLIYELFISPATPSYHNMLQLLAQPAWTTT